MESCLGNPNVDIKTTCKDEDGDGDEQETSRCQVKGGLESWESRVKEAEAQEGEDSIRKR